LVTNDEDFSTCTVDQVYAVVWLKVPQNNISALKTSFTKMLAKVKIFGGKLIILRQDSFEKYKLENWDYSL